MEWRDAGIVVGVRRHGETSVILDVLTRGHGRHLGLVRGGRSRRQQPVLQPGNDVEVTWRARIDDQLGSYVVEPVKLRAGRLMESAVTLHALSYVCALVRLLPERDPHPELHERVEELLDRLDTGLASAVDVVLFELALLGELGFGLDLDRCAVTGTTQDLAFVSPRTGRAVCREAGRPYADRILELPGFIREEGPQVPVDAAAVAAGFRLTEHFLIRDVFGPRGEAMPAARFAYLRALLS